MEEIYFFGMRTNVIFVVGLCIVCFLSLGLNKAISFVNDREFKRPKWFIWWKGLVTESDSESIKMIFGATIISCALAMIWPITALALIIIAILYSLRFAVRTGKTLIKLKKVAHDHPEGVEKMMQEFEDYSKKKK